VLPRLNLGLVLLIVICFATPFAAVSCDGHRVAEATGIQLALGADASNVTTGIGNELMKATTNAQSAPQQLPMQPAAAVALALVLAAAVLALLGLANRAPQRFAAYEASIFALAAVSLYLLQTHMNSAFEKNEATILFELQFLPGYWAAFSAVIAGALVNFLAIYYPAARQPT
jgi:hypothetical protein